jgi:hypothetical protein
MNTSGSPEDDVAFRRSHAHIWGGGNIIGEVVEL